MKVVTWLCTDLSNDDQIIYSIDLHRGIPPKVDLNMKVLVFEGEVDPAIWEGVRKIPWNYRMARTEETLAIVPCEDNSNERAKFLNRKLLIAFYVQNNISWIRRKFVNPLPLQDALYSKKLREANRFLATGESSTLLDREAEIRKISVEVLSKMVIAADDDFQRALTKTELMRLECNQMLEDAKTLQDLIDAEMKIKSSYYIPGYTLRGYL